jgi:DNA-binding transcriptional LysR family regulator
MALFESVRKREVDFGIGPSIDTTEFHFDKVMDDPLYALVPKRYISTSKRSISLATLTNMPLLVLNSATALRGMLEQALSERNLSFQTRYEFAQAQTLISMASAGLGAAILPRVAIPSRIDPATHLLQIVNPQLMREVAIITVRGQKLSPASLRLAELIKQLMPSEHTAPKRSGKKVVVES